MAPLTYKAWKEIPKNWATAPINPTCEHFADGKLSGLCGLPTAAAYPAMGGGWTALCLKHAMKHRPHIFDAEELIREGEKWDGF